MFKMRKLWSDECYVYYNIVCVEDQINVQLEKIQIDFPYLSFGTQISKVTKDTQTNLCRVIIKRFVTKDECYRHSTLPSVGWENQEYNYG